jgi:hypothetical protein
MELALVSLHTAPMIGMNLLSYTNDNITLDAHVSECYQQYLVAFLKRCDCK